MIFSLIAVAIVYLLFRVELHFTILLFPVVMIYTLLFSIGLGLILAAFNVFFRDIGHLYTVWVTAWMYFTPIIYPVSALPDAMVSFVKLNPLYYYVEYARDIMIYGNVPTLQQNIICIGFSLITLLIGLVVFKKKQDKFILYI
jgi:ABC-2 type transport system permease protein